MQLCLANFVHVVVLCVQDPTLDFDLDAVVSYSFNKVNQVISFGASGKVRLVQVILVICRIKLCLCLFLFATKMDAIVSRPHIRYNCNVLAILQSIHFYFTVRKTKQKNISSP